MRITSDFDSGNIQVIGFEPVKNHFRLKIRKDTQSDFFQWFHFRLTGADKKPCTFSILNAGQSAFPSGWPGYKVCVSYDRDTWFRVPTTYRKGVLSFHFKPQYNSVYFAYFSPYSYERHMDLIHRAQMSPEVKAEVIGTTHLGRNIDMLVIGRPSRKKKQIWVVARQHPGEPMAEWFVEGMIERLLDSDDAVSRHLLKNAVFYVVPNMNIDGSIAGNLRASASGANLNREWKNPTKKRSPEVFYVRNKMDETGVHLLLDVHGDEEIPYNFIAASEGIPGYDEYLATMEEAFKNHWMETCPDFQDTHKYPLDKFGEANMTLCSNQVAHRYGCLAFTIEMPFKDNKDMPDKEFGWSDTRSKILGASVLSPVLYVLDDLR